MTMFLHQKKMYQLSTLVKHPEINLAYTFLRQILQGSLEPPLENIA